MSHLNIAEAVPLGYVMVARVAKDAGVRALSIKGPVLARQQERSAAPRQSYDVDVLVHPEDVMAFSAHLQEAGWTETRPSAVGRFAGLHSYTFANPMWPIEIDVHFWFPGLNAPPEEVFEILWLKRESVLLAGGCRVTSPSREDHELISLTHSVRNNLSGNTSAGPLGSDKVSSEQLERWHLLGVAAEVFEAVGRSRREAHAASWLVECEWTLMTRHAHLKSVPFVFALSNANKREWPSIAWRYAWLSEPQLRERSSQVELRGWSLAAVRTKRIWVGLWRLREAVLVVDSERRSAACATGEISRSAK